LSSNVESSKTLATLGALLLFLSFIPVIGIIGIILLIIGMKGLSEHYQDESIYQNALRGLVFGIIGLAAVSAISLLIFLGGLFVAPAIGPFAVFGGVLALIVAFAFYLLMAMNFRRAFDALAERSGEHGFRTAGTLLFWGAVLTIIVVGLFLVWIAWIIAAIAFFSIRLTPTQPYSQQQYGYTPPPSSPPPAAQATRYCPYCGAPVDQNAAYCPNCGRQQPPA
jgi:uncharacterized membrane protein